MQRESTYLAITTIKLFLPSIRSANNIFDFFERFPRVLNSVGIAPYFRFMSNEGMDLEILIYNLPRSAGKIQLMM